MSETKYHFNFNTLGIGFWITVVLFILKLAGVVDLSIWWVLAPLFVSIGIFFLIVFVIGLLVIYFIDKEVDDSDDEDDEEDEDEEETD